MVRKLRVSPAAAAGGDRAVRQLAVHRGQAERLPVLSRASVWTDTDNQRTGIPPCMFEDGFGFERYVEWLLRRADVFRAARRQATSTSPARSFRDFIMAGRLRCRGGRADARRLRRPHDHGLHRCAAQALPRDARRRCRQRRTMMLAQSALWVGLLYDEAALAAAEALVRRQHWQDYAALARRWCRAAGSMRRAPAARCATSRATVLAIAAGRAARARRGATRRERTSRVLSGSRCTRSSAAGRPRREHWLATLRRGLERRHRPDFLQKSEV